MYVWVHESGLTASRMHSPDNIPRPQPLVDEVVSSVVMCMHVVLFLRPAIPRFFMLEMASFGVVREACL